MAFNPLLVTVYTGGSIQHGLSAAGGVYGFVEHGRAADKRRSLSLRKHRLARHQHFRPTASGSATPERHVPVLWYATRFAHEIEGARRWKALRTCRITQQQLEPDSVGLPEVQRPKI